jgi:hypothetical protein
MLLFIQVQKLLLKSRGAQTMTRSEDLLQRLNSFSLMEAIFGRRARRFGMGMEIPSGPLSYKSRQDPVPLTELEKYILVAAATGVTGWNFGVPFGPNNPDAHASFTVRFTGRTAPTPAGIGAPVLFFTDDDGCYVTRTRDVKPDRIREFENSADDLNKVIAVCREHTTRFKEDRLDLPAEPPHMYPPNLWMANKPGSTLFMPVSDASEQFIGFMALLASNGVMLIDHETGKPAGNLAPFVRSGLLNEAKQISIAEVQADVHEACSQETAFMGHNIVLTMQALGLGGLFFSGADRWSVLGARADQGVKGLGFRVVRDERWQFPNPVGLDGIYEALCPPYYPDMHAAVEAFAERKFGPDGAYNPEQPGPWKDSAGVKGSVTPYSRDFIDCLGEMAQYIYDKYGKFPGTITTIMLPGYVQTVHIDTEYYDKYYKPGAYLPSHAEHMKIWHADK